MKIKTVTIFCGSSHGNDPKIINDIKELGRLLGLNAEHVLYGGGMYGHLQDVMEAVGAADGSMDAILSPAYFDPNEVYPEYVNVVQAKNDEDRINLFLDADAFVVTPGGDGTIAEAMLSHNRNLSALFQNKVQKPVVFMNTNGFYLHLMEHFKHMSNVGYSNEKRQEQLHFENTPESVVKKLWSLPCL